MKLDKYEFGAIWGEKNMTGPSHEAQGIGVSEYREAEKGHGRIETRRCMAMACPKPLGASLWPHAQSIAFVEATREIGETISVERRYFVSTLPPDAKRIAYAVRSHWAIENGMH